MNWYDPDKLAIVYMTAVVDNQKIADDPPNMPYDNVRPEFVRALMDKTRNEAHGLDIYKTITQFSVLYGASTWHILYCDDPELQLDQTKYPQVRLHQYESDLVGSACELLNAIFVPNNMGARLAGWQLKVCMWPLFVCKAMKYNKRVSEMLLHDPTCDFDRGGEMRLDVSNIYTQGVSTQVRKIPAMVDVIKEWTGIQLEPLEKLKDSLCTDPEHAIQITDTYLSTMRDAIHKYRQLGVLWPR